MIRIGSTFLVAADQIVCIEIKELTLVVYVKDQKVLKITVPFKTDQDLQDAIGHVIARTNQV